ncbi:MAG: Rpn family recombination-promoting nuclease/putative transposase [Treponema sp.]|nr:Rpn family recombination-promoting nuclease/putative transposase [Treponema sp.]
MHKIQFEENDDPLDIRFDNVFKAVFTKDIPESKGALSKLISALIDREVSVSVINVNEPPVANIRDRQIRFDIKCKTESGELINVEMSLNPKPFEPVRLEYYAGKLFTGQDIRGVDKNYDNLKEAYQIAILAKKRFFLDESFIHNFQYYDLEQGVRLNGRSRIITLELSKLEKVVEKPVNKMNEKESWAVYFRYLTDKGKRYKINEILEHKEGIAMASEVLIHISRDEIEQARLESELKYELDTQSNLSWAKREGRLEGNQEIIDLLKSGETPEEIIKKYSLDPKKKF